MEKGERTEKKNDKKKSKESHSHSKSEKSDKKEKGGKGKGDKETLMNASIYAPTIKEPTPVDTATLLVHADDHVEKLPDLAPAIHVATTYLEENEEGLSYARAHNKTRDRVEKVLGDLEGGRALVYSSGSAATMAALYFFKPKRLFISEGYRGTHTVIETFFTQTGEVQLDKRKFKLDPTSELAAGDLVWLETPKNPTCQVDDIPFWVTRAHASGARVCVDATFGSPILIRPLALGVDMVMHSATKFLSGMSDVLAGVLAVKRADMFGQLARQRITLGFTLGNLENFLLLRSLRTLELRVTRQSENATAVAAWLAKHENVNKVWHPSLPSDPSHALAKQLLKIPPPILSFEVSSAEGAVALAKKLKLIAFATSLGGVHTTIDHRLKHDPGVAEGLLRLSLGIEATADLIADLSQGFEAAKAKLAVKR